MVEEGILFNPSSKMTHDSDLKLLNPVASGFQAFEKRNFNHGFLYRTSPLYSVYEGYDFYHSILDARGNAPPKAETSQEEWVSRVDESWMFGC